jgi:Uma2 family endonuclease
MTQAPTQAPTQALPRPIEFAEFLEIYPEDGKPYELWDGNLVEMLPTGPHELISSFLATKLQVEIWHQGLPYVIPKTSVVKPFRQRSGYCPDCIVLRREALTQELLWPKASTVAQGETIALVIEVVSTNWRDDYLTKFGDYEEMGISEYWLVDFRALGATRYLGKPKQPTITVCTLAEGEYTMTSFRTGQPLVSQVFPDLVLTTDEIFAVGSSSGG